MAQDFSNNSKFAIQAMLEETFDAQLYTGVFTKSPNALVGLAEKQTARVNPIRSANNKMTCEGYEAHFMKIDSETLPTLSGTAVNARCTIPTGEAMTGNKVTYSKDIFNVDSAEYDDGLCGTVFQGDELRVRAELMMALMHKTLMAVNGEVISRVNTNKQTATYASDVGTISGGDVFISDLDLWKPKNIGTELMPYFDDIAAHNNLPDDYLILGGSILANAANVTDYTRLNDNERAEGAIISAYADRLIIDRRGMADASLSESLFLIDPRVYGFFQDWNYDATVAETGDENNTKEFSMPLMYAVQGNKGTGKQVRQFQYANGGQLVDAWMDFRHQIVCNSGGASNGYPSAINRFQRFLQAAFLLAPADGSGRTGIIKVTRGTP